MPNKTLLEIAEMALDRSLAPRKGNIAPGASGNPSAPGGLVVNLNFAEPGPSRANKVVDVTPQESTDVK